MTDKKINPLWNLLRSLKLTLVLLSILAVASMIGTIIQQQEGAELYHSLWFRLILLCLSINLIICSLDRFPLTLKIFRLTPSPDRSKAFEDATERSILLPGAGCGEVSAEVQGRLRGRFGNLAVKEKGDAVSIYCEKGRFSLFSVYLVHLSVLFILAGAITGSIFGFNAYVDIPEGSAIDSVVITDGDSHSQRDLGFIVRCDKFLIDYYDNGVPKEYRSDLVFIEDGRSALSGALRVNHPITFRGITFYQASYGATAGDKVRIRALNGEKGGEATVIEAELGKAVMLPDNKGELILTDIKEDFMNMLGPAVEITVRSPSGEETPMWLFKDQDVIKKKFAGMFDQSPKFSPSAYSPFTFVLEEMSTVPYTVLQVTRDPGVRFVFIGFALMIIGLFLTFYTSHRRFWIRIEAGSGDVKISLAGTANKNPVGLERELDSLLLALGKVTGGRKQ
jgi:cytochrome c biogenesis protein